MDPNSDDSAFARLIQQLSPERRAAAIRVLADLDNDDNGAIFLLYSELFSKIDRDNQTQMVGLATREKLLLEQLAKTAAASQQTIRTEVGRLHQKALWKRILINRLSEIVIALALVVTLVVYATPRVMQHLIDREVAELTTMRAEVQEMRAEQTALIKKIVDNPSAFVAHAKFSGQAYEKGDSIAHTLAAIATMLNLPDGVRMAKMGKEVVIAGPSSEFKISSADGETRIGLSRSLPDLDAGDSIDDTLRRARAGKLNP